MYSIEILILTFLKFKIKIRALIPNHDVEQLKHKCLREIEQLCICIAVDYERKMTKKRRNAERARENFTIQVLRTMSNGTELYGAATRASVWNPEAILWREIYTFVATEFSLFIIL